MEIKEVVKDCERNYREEKNIIEDFAGVVKPCISLKEIKKRLDDNGFNGVYILSKEKFALVNNSANTIGFYNQEGKVIVINESHYAFNKKSGVHEMGHAFLDGRNEREISELSASYGVGLEEGAMSILEVTSNVEELNKRNCTAYPLQARFFHQLNTLYGYSNCKEYKNLLIHLLKEPEKFIPLIRDVYEDIFKEQYPEFKHLLSDRSALAMISGTDALIPHSNEKLNVYLNCLNSLYLNVADEDIRSEKFSDYMFMNAKHFIRTNEEKLFSQIFGNDKIYFERQQAHLEVLLDMINQELEALPIKENSFKNKVLVKR